MRVAIFPLNLSRVPRLPRKRMPGHSKCYTCHTKISLANLKIWCSKMQTPLRKSAPWPPNIFDEHKCILADPLQMSHACHHSWKCYKTLTFWSLLTRCRIPCPCHAKPHLNVQSGPRPSVFNTFDFEMCCTNGVHFFDIWASKNAPRLRLFCTFWLRNVLRATMTYTFWTSQLPKVLRNVLRATTGCTFSTSQLPKVLQTLSLYIILFSSKCASRHNDVHIFDISISKVIRNGPNMRCFAHFDLEMCFAPEWPALFRHLNFQKWSGVGVFFIFWVRNVLRTTTACMRVRMWRFFKILGSTFWRCQVCKMHGPLCGLKRRLQNRALAVSREFSHGFCFTVIWQNLVSISFEFKSIQSCSMPLFPDIPTWVTGPIFSIEQNL